jgi:hypothetical protein
MTRHVPEKPKTTIRITAEGKCKVQPDSVRVETGIITYGKTFEKAKEALDQKVQQLLDEVKKSGYDYGNYWADDLNHAKPPHRPAEIDKEKIQSHELTQTIRWQFPLDKAALETLCKICARHIPEDGVELVYGCENRTKYRDQAIQNALEKARVHVNTLARETGLKVGRIKSIEVSPEALDRWYNIYSVRHYTIFINNNGFNPHFFPPDHILTEHILVEWELEQKDG